MGPRAPDAPLRSFSVAQDNTGKEKAVDATQSQTSRDGGPWPGLAGPHKVHREILQSDSLGLLY